MKQYYENNKLEIGLDEAGRGRLLGPVFAAGVILNDAGILPPYPIKDSKKCSAKVRSVLRKYIEDANSIAYSVESVDTRIVLIKQ